MAKTKVRMLTDKSWSSWTRWSNKIKYDATTTACYPKCGKDICQIFSWVSMHLSSYSLMSPAWLPVIFSLNLRSHHCMKLALIQMQRMIHKFMTRMVQPLAMNRARGAKPQNTTPWLLMKQMTETHCHTVVCVLFTQWGLGRNLSFNFRSESDRIGYEKWNTFPFHLVEDVLGLELRIRSGLLVQTLWDEGWKTSWVTN